MFFLSLAFHARTFRVILARGCWWFPLRVLMRGRAMRCPAKVSGPSAGQEIAAVSLAAENELGRMRQEAAGGSQRSFPVVLTSGATVNGGGKRGLLSFLTRFVFSQGSAGGKMDSPAGKCGSDSGLGSGLTLGCLGSGVEMSRIWLHGGSLCLPSTAHPSQRLLAPPWASSAFCAAGRETRASKSLSRICQMGL